MRQSSFWVKLSVCFYCLHLRGRGTTKWWKELTPSDSLTLNSVLKEGAVSRRINLTLSYRPRLRSNRVERIFL